MSAPDLLYPLFTAAMFLASALCGYHAWRNREHLVFYAGSVVYGLLLEKLVVLRFEAYTYPAARMLDAAGIPLAIGFGWSAVIYAGFVTARRFDLPEWSVPAFVALYGLHVDLAMDAVAIRVPFWTWSNSGDWFGVPLGNFFGWFLVGLLFPAVYLRLRARSRRPLVLGGGSILGAVALLVVLLEAWNSVTGDVLARKVAVLGVAVLLSVVVLSRASFTLRPVPWTVTAATLLFHGFFLAVLLVLGLHARLPILLVVSLLMAGVGLAIHFAPSLAAMGGRPTSRAG